MRKISEIRQDLNAKIAEVKTIDASNAEAVKKGMDDLATLTRELELATAAEAAAQRAADKKIEDLMKGAGRSFSFSKMLREACEGNVTGLEADVLALGAEEYKRQNGCAPKGVVLPSAFLRASAGQNAGTNADGGYAKEVMPVRYIDALKERLVIAKLGATILGDLVGTVPVVSVSEISAAWKAEGATTSVSKSTFARVELTPHRASVVAAFSKDLLAQTSADVEGMLLDRIMSAHATLIEDAAINGNGTGNAPTGILNTTGIEVVEMGTNGDVITWGKVVDLETAINSQNANRGKLGYLTNAKVIGAMKQTPKVAGAANFIYEGGMLNGHAADYTNLVPANLVKGTSSDCSAMIFGNFQDLYVGSWGGLEIVVDPYTLAANGDVRLVLNAYNDVKVAEPKSFAAIKDIKA